MKRKLRKLLKQVWLQTRGYHWEYWVALIVFLGAAVLGAGVLAGWVHLYAGDEGEGSNRYYLLSAIAQALAAILALAVTATLVATQLAAQTFTPRVINHRLRDPWLWIGLGLYFAAILASLAGIAQTRATRANPVLDARIVDLTLVLTGVALLYLVPFTAAVLRSLETVSFIRYLLEREDYRALEDIMRKAMNEGLVRQVSTAMLMLRLHAINRLWLAHGAPTRAREFAELGVRLGKFAAAEKDPEAIVVAMQYLTAMTTYCTDHVFRGAADVFNESVVELQKTAEEAFG